MDIKIRSQAGGQLVDATNKNIVLGGRVNELNQIIATDFGGPSCLGIYKDMNKATEVLDKIQQAIELGFKNKETGIVIVMPE